MIFEDLGFSLTSDCFLLDIFIGILEVSHFLEGG